MPTIEVHDVNRASITQVEVNEDVFEKKVNESIYYEVIKMQMANARMGTACTKGRSDVRGGGAKPWRQKGTGRARAGTSRSPIWKGGGIVFGPKPRDYSMNVPKKIKKQALCGAISQKRADGNLTILDKIELNEIKTAKIAEILNKLDLKSVLIIEEGNKNLVLSAKNISGVKILSPEGLNLYDILYYKDLVITQPCLEKIQRRLLA
jgi:large subunit ribosomal protein L4